MKNHYVETDLLKIKHLSSVREDENYRFRKFLKDKENEKIDRIVRRLHDELIRQIDCTLCGNCCCQLKPELYRDDIAVLARLENTTPENYQDCYCEEADFGEFFLKTIPCRYLVDKKCCIYENRPEECRSFPYTGKENFISRLWSMIDLYGICPIVFNLMERLKGKLRFRR